MKGTDRGQETEQAQAQAPDAEAQGRQGLLTPMECDPRLAHLPFTVWAEPPGAVRSVGTWEV